VLLISSTPRGHLDSFPFYAGTILLLAAISRAPMKHVAGKCAAGAPFIVLASALLLLSGEPGAVQHAISVACKAFSALILIGLLTAVCPLQEFLWAMRRLGAPQSLNLIVALMHRYILLLSEEYRRMERGRDSRTVRPVVFGDLALYANQFGLLFVRSWDRAERVYAAMLSRGFTGVLPNAPAQRTRWPDIAVPVAAVTLFCLARFAAPPMGLSGP
jgi:cobalt/nickel transport system permease protein